MINIYSFTDKCNIMSRHTHADTPITAKTHTHTHLWPDPPYWNLFRGLPGQSAISWPQRLGLGRRCRGASSGQQSARLRWQRLAWVSQPMNRWFLIISLRFLMRCSTLLIKSIQKWMTSTHPCLRLCLLRSSLSPILPRDGERVRAPLGLLELRRVPVCLNPCKDGGERSINSCESEIKLTSKSINNLNRIKRSMLNTTWTLIRMVHTIKSMKCKWLVTHVQ